MPVIKSGTPKAISKNISEIMHSYKKKGTIGTSTPSSPKKAQKQAIAIAMSTARRYGKKKAFGGPNLNRFNMENMVMRGSAYGLRHEGMISSSVPGRTDKLPMNVRSGSYVLPADIPSALGQGNSAAGGQILKNMFSSGPYGMAAPHIRSGRGAPAMRMSMPRMRQDGGPSDSQPDSPTWRDRLRGWGIPTSFGEATSGQYPLGFAAIGKAAFDAQQRKKQSGGEAEGGDSHVPIVAAGGEYIIHPEVVRDIGHGNLKAGHKVLDRFVLRVRKENIKTLKKLPGPKQ